MPRNSLLLGFLKSNIVVTIINRKECVND
jgi:hypothetical protein